MRNSNHDSPENYTQVNTTEDYSDKEDEGNRPISKQQRLIQKKLNDEQREQKI
jgi:hypothetical protein